MFNMGHYLVEAVRRQDERAMAAEHRLQLEAMKGNRARNLWVRNALVRTGQLLENWGRQLQTRFTTGQATTNAPGAGLSLKPR